MSSSDSRHAPREPNPYATMSVKEVAALAGRRATDGTGRTERDRHDIDEGCPGSIDIPYQLIKLGGVRLVAYVTAFLRAEAEDPVDRMRRRVSCKRVLATSVCRHCGQTVVMHPLDGPDYRFRIMCWRERVNEVYGDGKTMSNN